MKFTPKLPPQDINVSKRNHLKDFFVLLSGFFGVIIIVLLILVALADYLVSYIPIDVEKQLFQSMHQVAPKASDPESERGKVEQYLHKLVVRLNNGWPEVSKQLTGKSAERQKFTIAVIHMNAPNAFILPGGHIGVTHGLLRLVKSENGLAMVIAHEMAHQYKRHPLRTLGRGIVVLLAMSTLTSSDDSWWVGSLSSNAAKIGLLKFSRDQEREADKIGLALVTQLYGHRKGATEFFESISNMAKLTPGYLAFLNSHPATHERLKALKDKSQDTTHKLSSLPKHVIRFGKINFETHKDTLEMLKR